MLCFFFPILSFLVKLIRRDTVFGGGGSGMQVSSSTFHLHNFFKFSFLIIQINRIMICTYRSVMRTEWLCMSFPMVENIEGEQV